MRKKWETRPLRTSYGVLPLEECRACEKPSAVQRQSRTSGRQRISSSAHRSMRVKLHRRLGPHSWIPLSSVHRAKASAVQKAVATCSDTITQQLCMAGDTSDAAPRVHLPEHECPQSVDTEDVQCSSSETSVQSSGGRTLL